MSASRKRKGDEELAEELMLEGFVHAGTPEAFEALPPAEAIAPRCVRCGSPISYVFLTNKGLMGGDCLATLTGDQSTRKLARKLSQALNVEQGYRKITGIRIDYSAYDRDYVVLAVSSDQSRYSEYTGLYEPRTHYLLSCKANQLPVVEAMAAHEAEVRGLTFESPVRAEATPQRNPADDRAIWSGWSCVSGPAELVEFLVDRGKQVSYSTFRKYVDVKTADFLERWQRGLLPTDYSVTFLKTELPDGTRAWVMQHSGIEYAFVAPGVDFYQAIEDIKAIYDDLEDIYGGPANWPCEAIDEALAGFGACSSGKDY